MDNVLLVSEQRMKQWTALDNNIRIDLLTPSILQAQDIYIQDRLGTLFYDRLKSGVMNDDLNSDEESFLKDYVGPTLMQYALYLVIPHLKYKMVEKGLLSGSSEESTQTTLEEMKYMRQSALDTAQFYDDRMREYLSDNPGMFPQYETPGTDGMYPNKKTPYFSGLVTDVRKLKNYNYYEDKCDGCPSDGPAVEN